MIRRLSGFSATHVRCVLRGVLKIYSVEQEIMFYDRRGIVLYFRAFLVSATNSTTKSLFALATTCAVFSGTFSRKKDSRK